MQTTVRTAGDAGECADFVLPVGFMMPGHALNARPPAPLELENAIAALEDVVMPLARSIPPSSQLATADALALRLCELAGSARAQGGVLDIAAVEAQFNELADVSQGRPSAGSPFLDPALCGYLLILREFMHHLAFDTLVVER